MFVSLIVRTDRSAVRLDRHEWVTEQPSPGFRAVEENRPTKITIAARNAGPSGDVLMAGALTPRIGDLE
jgi:hypothetical protein